MNAGEIVLTGLGTAIAAGSAVFAWVQAKAATDSRKDALEAQGAAEAARDEALELSRKATAAAERQAAAQEEANRLEIEARKPRDWTGPRYINDSVNGWLNTSGREIVVLSSKTYPEGARSLAGLEQGEYPFSVPEGGTLRTAKANFPRVKADMVIVEWRFHDEASVRETRFPFH